MSKKETRRLYCDEEELEYAKHCIQQRRAGLILQNADSDPNGALEDKLDRIQEDLNYLFKEALPDLQSRLEEQIESLRFAGGGGN